MSVAVVEMFKRLGIAILLTVASSGKASAQDSLQSIDPYQSIPKIQSNAEIPYSCILGMPSSPAGDLLSQGTKHVYDMLDVSSFPKDTEVIIEFELDSRGRANKPIVNKSSGNKQLDFACLEAVYATNFGSPPPSLIKLPVRGDCPILRCTSSTTDYLAKHPAQTNDYLIHLIPVMLQGRLFDTSELKQHQNIVSLGNDIEQARLKLTKIYSDWSKFLQQNKNPTKQDVLQNAQLIRSKYELRGG